MHSADLLGLEDTQCGLVGNTERKQFVYMNTPQGTKF